MRKTTVLALMIAALALLTSTARAQEYGPLAHEAVVNAPVEQVWAAFTTKEGIESWMVAHAAIDLRVGGKMQTQYDPKGAITDNKAIENTILSYEPKRMLSFRVTKAPEGFPFPNAIKLMWTVVYFEAVSEKTTRVREVSLGFGADEESQKMREFFDRGNAYTMQKLQEHFAPRAGAK